MFVPIRLKLANARGRISGMGSSETLAGPWALIALFVASGLVACIVNVPEFQPEPSGTDPTTTPTATASVTADDTGAAESYTPDGEACVAAECEDAADCCVGVQPTVTTGLVADDAGCPSKVYPNNWDCVLGVDTGHCEHGGCSSTADCIVPGLECHQIDDVGFCVRFCDENTPCPDLDGDGQPDTLCTGVADDDVAFCEQPLS